MSLGAIITDIEGTTSSVDFVYDTLVPYARAHLASFLESHWADSRVEAIHSEIEHLVGKSLGAEQMQAQLLAWMDEDRKVGPLKALQGLIWAEGYARGELQGHVYADAAQALQVWAQAGYRLYVYSSGSVLAQKLLFGHSCQGDLTPLFSGFFDTTVGGKRDAVSYQRIAEAVQLPAKCLLFLSDVREELNAAQLAGLHTWGLARAGADLSPHQSASRFDEIDPASVLNPY